MNYENDYRNRQPIFAPRPRSAKSENDWPQDPNVNIDKLAKTEISWAVKNWIWLLGIIATAVIYITIRVSTFWYQAEVFRNDVAEQLRELNTTVTSLTKRISDVMDSPYIVRTRDLRDFCLLAERSNPTTFRCPDGIIGVNRSAKSDLRGSPIGVPWQPTKE